MDVRDAFYHGVRHQIRRVLEAMGEKRIEMGLTAFESGDHSWNSCFFARAYPELQLHLGDAESKVAEALGMGTNRVPMRIVYHTFDNAGIVMNSDELREFILGFLDEKRDPAVQTAIEKLIRSTNYENVADKPVDFSLCPVHGS